MKRLIRRLAFISIMACVGGAAAASTNGSITGTVVDQSDQPFPGVVVKIEQLSMGYSASKVTDIDGAFTVGNLQPANYTLTFTTQGFATPRSGKMSWCR